MPLLSRDRTLHSLTVAFDRLSSEAPSSTSHRMMKGNALVVLAVTAIYYPPLGPPVRSILPLSGNPKRTTTICSARFRDDSPYR